MTDGYAAGPPPGIGPGPGGPGPGGEGGPPPGGQYAAGPGPGGPPHGGQYAAGAMQGMPTNGANGAAPDGGYGAPDGVGEKRPRDEDYGSNKRPGNPADGASEGPETVFRLLCDQSIIGPMMQRVSAIQQSTGAFIQAIQEAPPHCVERVIVVSAPKLARPGEMQNDAQKAIYELFDAQLQVDRNSSGPVLRCAPCYDHSPHFHSAAACSCTPRACMCGSLDTARKALFASRQPITPPLVPCVAASLSSDG